MSVSTHITAGAVTISVDDELGVAAVIVESVENTDVRVQHHRASRTHLEAVGALNALILATKRRTDTHVTILTGPDTADAVAEYLATGRTSRPDLGTALHALGGHVARVREAGVTVDFTPGQISPPDHAQALIAEAVATARRQAHETASARTAWKLPEPDAAWVAENDATVVYTDGSCVQQTGFGSWAWWVDEDRYAAGTAAGVTSTWLERKAVAQALTAHPGPVLIVTDLVAIAAPDSNRVLSGSHRRILRRIQRRVADGTVRFVTVKGHATCPGNLTVDRLAGRTREDGWAAIVANPERHHRLVALARRNEATLRAARAEANDRWHRHNNLVPTR